MELALETLDVKKKRQKWGNPRTPPQETREIFDQSPFIRNIGDNGLWKARTSASAGKYGALGTEVGIGIWRFLKLRLD